MTTNTDKPLSGIKVIEAGGIGPTPFCGMLLADLGADVLKICPIGGDDWPNPVTGRGKRELELDLKDPTSAAACLDLITASDVVIEGFRPGVMERLGLGPDVACKMNGRLIYGRMTGWGQEGPLVRTAGHDIDYIALTGALAAMGTADGVPLPPLNLVGDFGGGALYLAMAIASALFWRERSGRGQVIDAAIVDGAASLMATFCGFVNTGALSVDRQDNVVAGGAPYYRCYRCADGRHIAVGAVEHRFYNLLLGKLGLEPDALGARDDPATWPEASRRLAEIFATRTRAEWCDLFEGTDACFAPVLELGEAASHPHMRERGVYLKDEHGVQPAPAPRFSATPLSPGGAPVRLTGIPEAQRAWGL